MKENRPAFVYTARTDARSCPVCRTALTGATGVSLDPDDRRPELELDAITCCAYCGSILVVTAIGFRLATDADLAALDPDLRALVFQMSADLPRRRRQAAPGHTPTRGIDTEPGRYYGRREPGGPLELIPPGGAGRPPDAVICRRVADYAPAPVPAGAGITDCQNCQAPIAYNPAHPLASSSIPKICMQCAGIEPVPLVPFP